MNFNKLIDRNIDRLKKFNKLNDSDIYCRCSFIRFKDIDDNSNRNSQAISKIQSVLGFEEWESLIYKNNNMISMLNSFVKFITNPRRINR